MRRLIALRDARLYLAGQALSLLGDLSLSLAMGVWVKQLTGSSGAAGLTFVAFLLPQLASPLAGMVVDRTRRRPLLIAVNLASAVAVAPLVLVHDAGDVWIVYAVSLALGASAMVLGAGQSALLVGLLPGELLAHGNAALQTLREGLRLLAPLAGAGLFAWLGGGAVAALDAATFLAAAAALALMRLREPRPRPAARSRRGELGAGIAHVRATPVLRRLIAAGALAVVALGLSESVLFAVVDDGLHRPPAFLGVLFAVQGAGAVAAGATAPALMARAGERGGCALGMALAAAGLPLLATSSLALVLAGAIVFGRPVVDPRRGGHAASAQHAGAPAGPRLCGPRNGAGRPADRRGRRRRGARRTRRPRSATAGHGRAHGRRRRRPRTRPHGARPRPRGRGGRA